MSLIVHAPVGAGRLLKAQIAAQYTGVELKFVPDFKMRETNKSPAFLAKFPLGKVPAVETPYGPLTESGAIARYVARVRPDAGLMGGSFYQQALVDQWIDFAVTEIEATAGPNWIYPVWGYGDFNQKKYDEAKATVSTLLSYVDTHLIDNTFLTGDNITLGDISLWTALRQLFTNVLPEAVVSAQWPSVLRWFQTLLAQKQFAAVTSVEWVTAEKYAKGNPLAGPVEEKKEEKKAEAAPAPVVAAKAVEAVAPVAVKEVTKPVEAPKEVVKEVVAETPKESAAPAPKAEEAKKGKGGKGKKEAKAEEPKPVEATPAPAPAPVAVEAKAAAVVAEEPKPVEAAAPKAEEAKKGKGGKGKQEGKKEAKAAPAAEEPKPAPVEVKAVETAAPTTAAAVPPSPKAAKKGKQEGKKETPAAAPVAAAAAAAPKAESPKTPKAKAEPKVEAPKTPKAKAEAKAETPKSAKKGKGK